MSSDSPPSPVVKCVFDSAHEMGEGPYWCSKRNALFYIEMWKREIHKHVPSTNEHVIATISGDFKCLTFVMPFEDPQLKDYFIVGVDNKLGYVKWNELSHQTGNVCIMEQIDSSNSNRLNDAKISPSGILFMGSMGLRRPDGSHEEGVGKLFKMVNGRKSLVIGNMTIPNGMTWSSNQRVFYIADSASHDIFRYDYDCRTGNLSDCSVLINWKEKNLEGFPDGMTIDENNNLWIATFSGKSVVCLSTQTGEVLRTIKIPAYQVTSVTFGGSDVDQLFVTTAAFHLTEDEKKEPGLLSGLYRIENLGLKGAASNPYRI